MNYQFPPSSPLLGPQPCNANPFDFNVKQKVHATPPRGRAEYPTPEPSSCTFRSSSPAREPVAIHQPVRLEHNQQEPHQPELALTVSINRDFNILNPDSSIGRVTLLPNQNQITIGRSSRANDFLLGDTDTYVSRVHILVNYDEQCMVLKCVGTNGLLMRIPRKCFVFATDSKNNFVVVENLGKPLDLKFKQECSKSIVIDEAHTEFCVNNGEAITMPTHFTNILLQVNKNVVLLNPLDCLEELTDEEDHGEILEPESCVVTPITSFRATITPRSPKKVDRLRNEIASQQTPSKSLVNGTVSRMHIGMELLPEHLSPIDNNEISTKGDMDSSSFEIFQEVSPAPKTTQSLTVEPRQALSESDSNQLRTPKKRVKSPVGLEPAKKSNKKIKVFAGVPDQDLVKDVKNIDEINNVLVNHLAFSRLSSTPASFLNTISALTASLTIPQVRVVLHNINCIGTISRVGVDAAGKPLEEEYYYMPERDSDEERRKLVAGIKGSAGLRSCRKTHKQYFWKKPAPIKK